MSALNFPSSPTVGQTYTANGLTYEWNGQSWVTYNVLQDLTADNTGTGGASPVIYDGFTAKTISYNTLGAIPKAASSTDNAVVRFDGTTGGLVQNSAATISDAGDMANVGSIAFDGTNPTSPIPGTIWFDSSTNTWNAQQNAITQQIGEELFVYGRASEAITDGQVIVVTGSYGTTGTVTFAPAPIGTTDGDSIIGIATEPIAKNDFGRITAFGTVHDLNTTGFADGDAIYYDPTVLGGYTKTKPSAPNIKVQVGIITKAAGGTNGSIAVNVLPGSTLGGTDSNVQLTSSSNGNILTYDGAAGYWKNTNIASGTGISVSKATDGTLTVTNTAPSSGGTVTSVGLSAPAMFTVGSSPVTNSGTLALTYSGTALPTTSGGTGLTSFTANGIVYASSTSALATGSTFNFNGTSLGFGVAGSSAYGFRQSYTGSSAVSQYGMFLDSFSDSSGTNTTVSIRAKARTSAAAYTCGTAFDFVADTIAAGAGSTITSVSGFYCADQTAGTTNIGYWSTVSSGSNKYNIYASGTASNYFNGGVNIGATSDPGAGNLSTTGTISSGTTIKTAGYTVATLPTGVTGARAYVTNALAPTYGATVVGGGAVTIPVFYNGTNWICA